MEKIKWINVLELFVAAILFALFWNFLEGPCRRMAHMLHGYNYEGRKIDRNHEQYREYAGEGERA